MLGIWDEYKAIRNENLNEDLNKKRPKELDVPLNNQIYLFCYSYLFCNINFF